MPQTPLLIRLLFHHRVPQFIMGLVLLIVPPKASANEDLVLTRPLNLLWALHDLRFHSDLAATSYQETVYVPASENEIVALRIRGGEFKWRSEIGGVFSASPLSDEQGVYVASENSPTAGGEVQKSGFLRLLGSNSGVTVWSRSFPTRILSVCGSPLKRLLVSTEDMRLYSINKLSGEVFWARQLKSAVKSHLTPYNNRIYVGDVSGQIFSIDLQTGATLRLYQTRGSIKGQPVVHNDSLYTGSSDRSVYSFDLASGKLHWRIKTGAAVQSIVPAGKNLLVTSLDNYIYGISPENGNKIWKRRLPGRINAAPLVTNGTAIVAPVSGEECIILSTETGKIINTVNVGEGNDIIAAPVLAQDLLLIPTRQGLYAYSSGSRPPRKE